MLTEPIETESAAVLAYKREIAELKAMLESRDRQSADAEVGTAQHLRDPLYAHGTSVPQDATLETIQNLESNFRGHFYVSPKMQANLKIPSDMVPVFVRKPERYEGVESVSRVEEIKVQTDDQAFVVEKSPWRSSDLVMMAVPKAMIEARDAEAEAYRHLRETGQHLIPADQRAQQAGIDGYAAKYMPYADGHDPMKRDPRDVRAEHDRNVATGLIGPTSQYDYNDIMNGRLPTFTKERIEADEDRHRGGARHHQMTRETIQEMAAATSSRGAATFGTGGVGFGPQSTRERTATIAAARQQTQRR